MKSTLLNALLAALLVAMSAAAWLQIEALRFEQQLTSDRAELKHVKYGMLNADNWVDQVTSILERKIQDLEIKGQGRVALKNSLERILHILITEANERMRMAERSGDWLDRAAGQFKGVVRDSLVDIETVRAGVPEYAEEILAELEKPEARRELTVFLDDVMRDISRSTFAEVDRQRLEGIYQRYDCDARLSCLEAVNRQIRTSRERSQKLTLAVLGLALLLLLLSWLAVRQGSFALVLLTLGSLVLMLCGVLTPMIEVEAQITNLRFTLLGEPISFHDEVFYFQSKSVLDVVSILTATKAWDMVMVGILIMTFSVLFPLAKLAASLLYIYDVAGLRASTVVNFFALKSGKWSMADVMVVAIFMAYIGFNGLITSQLGAFVQGAASAGVDVLTTNGTSLQAGFFMFLAFCLFSLLTSSLVESRAKAATD